jgi:hypothetical protein
MVLFSERNNYGDVQKEFVRECITTEIRNAIYNVYYDLDKTVILNGLELYIWQKYYNKKIIDFFPNSRFIFLIIGDKELKWYNMFDIIELTIEYLLKSDGYYVECDRFIDSLNTEFERLHYAYRIINGKIVEITSQQEIDAIDGAITASTDNVAMHLNCALEKYSLRPNPDYRNSIKESISAVEALCRNITGKKDFKNAIDELEKKGLNIPKVLKEAFIKLYAYTNQPDTGIRHSLQDEANVQERAEALYMLVTCSAFVNYLNNKLADVR